MAEIGAAAANSFHMNVTPTLGERLHGVTSGSVARHAPSDLRCRTTAHAVGTIEPHEQRHSMISPCKVLSIGV